MERRRNILPYLFLAVLVILLLHLAGNDLFFYWRLPGYDKVVHLVSGVWIGLTALSLAFFRKKYSSGTAFSVALGITVLVGIGWELFEYHIGATSLADSQFVPDTVGDVSCDIIGGTLASIIYQAFFS